MVLLLALGFALRGLFRGLTAEVFGLLGLVAGLWAAGFIARWVGAHWEGARPAVVFWILRWLVAGLAGVAVAALFAWWGALASAALKTTPVGWIEKPGGVVVGAVLGAAVAAMLLVVLLLLPWTDSFAGSAAKARVTRPLLSGGTRALTFSTRYFPGSDWLRGRFLEAERRAARPARRS